MTKLQFWANLGCFWTPWEHPPRTLQKKKKNLTGSFKLWPILKVCTVLKNVLAKAPKIIRIRRKEEKGHFGPNFGAILGKIWVTVILKILKLKVTLFDQLIHWNNVFYFIQKCYGIQKLLMILWKEYFH